MSTNYLVNIIFKCFIFLCLFYLISRTSIQNKLINQSVKMENRALGYFLIISDFGEDLNIYNSY